MSICQTNPTKKLTLITKVFVLKDLLLASQSVTDCEPNFKTVAIQI